MVRQMQSPGVAASSTALAPISLGGVGRSPYAGGANQPGVPGTGYPFGPVGGGVLRISSGSFGAGRLMIASGRYGPGGMGGGLSAGGALRADGAGGPVGGPECSDPHAVSVVIVLVTTANGCCGSRVSSTIGSRVSSGATGAGGSSNAGRCFGAYAAICCAGGAIESGATSGLVNSAGRSTGAYSGPSSQVATQSW